MKKLIAFLLVLTIAVGLLACGNQNPDETAVSTTEATTEATTESTEDTTGVPEANDATKVMSAIWNAMDESKKFFAMGGDMENMVDNAPGNYSLTDEGIGTILYVPADQLKNLDQAGSLVHGMLLNNFTGAVFRMADGADAAAFADAMKSSIDGVQWICGTPEKLLIAVIDGEYVLTAFGLNQNVTAFEAALGTAYPDAKIKYSEAITF